MGPFILYNMKGVAVALITPFRNHAVDYAAFERILAYVEAYADAYVVLGTTGEPYTLSDREKEKVVRFVYQRRGQKRVIIGVEGNDTLACCARAKHWQRYADMLLCITPYCNRTTQQGLVAHYARLCDSTHLPVVAYNVPSRTGVNLEPVTLAQLALLPHFVGVKEASGNAAQIAQYAAICLDKGLSLYCGDDTLLPLFRALGACGIISAAANAIPQVIRRGWTAPLRTLSAWNGRYQPLLRRMFATINPIGVKYACAYRGLCSGELRLPLLSMASDSAFDALLSQFATISPHLRLQVQNND